MLHEKLNLIMYGLNPDSVASRKYFILHKHLFLLCMNENIYRSMVLINCSLSIAICRFYDYEDINMQITII